jgi:glycosyltransferase involved in cell wall biosynthesis
MNKNTLILTIHNKEKTIKKILHGIVSSIDKSFTNSIILINDGSTDNTDEIIKSYLFPKELMVKIYRTNDIWETKANNFGLRKVKTQIVTIVQDDMLLLEKSWDCKLYKKLKSKNIFSITGRACHDFKIEKGLIHPSNLFGREYPLGNKNFFGKAIGKILSKIDLTFIYKLYTPYHERLIANRGPVMYKMKELKELNYFDEKFAPLDLDDVDLCCRAFKKYNRLSACLPIYFKEINGSKQNNENSYNVWQKSYIKNSKIIISRHKDLVKYKN